MRTAIPVRGAAMRARILIALDPEDVEQVDEWARKSGLETRSGALRFLLKKALRTVRAEDQQGKAA